jgi:hypothetical protein
MATGRRIFWGIAGQHQLGRLLRWGYKMHRVRSDYLQPIKYPRNRKFWQERTDTLHESSPDWKPQAFCYHVGVEGRRPFMEMRRDDLLEHRGFFPFLLRKGLGLEAST